MIPSSPILQIEGLVLEAQVRRKTTTPVSDAHLTVNAGEVVGLVGESGSGKTLTALTVPRLLPHNVRVVAGMVQVNGVNMLTLSEEEVSNGMTLHQWQTFHIMVVAACRGDARWKRMVIGKQLNKGENDPIRTPAPRGGMG